MDTIYNYNNYEIILKKCVDSVYIQFLDKQLFKIYANTYIDVDLIKLTMGNLDMFYKVMSTVFESCITTNKDDKSTLEIFPSMKKLKLSIHHKFYLEFIFDLQLNLVEDQSLSAKDMCIKKLENSLNEVTRKYDELESFINDYMELTITDNFIYTHTQGGVYTPNQSYSIKINTPIIKIYGINANSGQIHNNSFDNNYYILYTLNNIKYNNNFKMIKCDKLIIDNTSNLLTADFGFNNFPLSITILVITGNINQSYFKGMYLPNINSIEFENCSELVNIYASLSHLKSLKNIKIKNCPKFQDRDVLLTHGYNFKAE
jgi:hypothetical protein